VNTNTQWAVTPRGIPLCI